MSFLDRGQNGSTRLAHSLSSLNGGARLRDRGTWLGDSGTWLGDRGAWLGDRSPRLGDSLARLGDGDGHLLGRPRLVVPVLGRAAVEAEDGSEGGGRAVGQRGREDGGFRAAGQRDFPRSLVRELEQRLERVGVRELGVHRGAAPLALRLAALVVEALPPEPPPGVGGPCERG